MCNSWDLGKFIYLIYYLKECVDKAVIDFWATASKCLESKKNLTLCQEGLNNSTLSSH